MKNKPTTRPPSQLVLLLFLTLLLAGCATKETPAQSIPLFVYHDFAPFFLPASEQNDLSHVFIDALNRDYEIPFTLTLISKPKLEQRIAQGLPTMVLWSNLKWFKQSYKLLASKGILWDADSLVMNSQHPIQLQSVQGLIGKRFCGIHGHIYRHFEELFQSDLITRIDKDNPEQCVTALTNQEVDFTQIERSTWLNQYVDEPKYPLQLLLENIDTFTRHIIVSEHYRALLPRINHSISRIKNAGQWQTQLRQFGGDDFIDLFDLSIEQLLEVTIE